MTRSDRNVSYWIRKYVLQLRCAENDNDRLTLLVSSLAPPSTKCRWDDHDHNHIPMSMPTAYSKPEPAFEYKSSSPALHVLRCPTEDFPRACAWLVPLLPCRVQLTGGSGSVDAEDANVGADADADADGGRQRAFGGSKAKASLSVTTIIGPRIQCVTIMPCR